ncbi:hypothetical protein C0Q70_14019 [Pomacea canaliculata]|uniref:Signal-induced proliferation-associated 1-like protein 2 n=1 Tax=Pomacea canaliculata TaxID=400727 RepID=A0A2T7NYU8_POMCA|nr:hypothetical protein C0Q70_14019 [Pomacea canaliculata]
MSTNSRVMAQSQNELDTIRQRARQAEEYYQRQNNPTLPDPGNRAGHTINSLSSYSRSTDKDCSQTQYALLRGQMQGQRSSMEDIMHSGLEPASSTNFYRAKMKAGIIDLRSSYNERIGSGTSRLRSRTFHGPHTGRTRTQTYAVDSSKSKPTASVTEKQHPQSTPSSARRNSRGLYRSNSNLEVDSVEFVEDERPVGSLHREYGSTSSLDLLGTGEKYAEIIKDFQNGNTPSQPPLQQLLREKLLNGSADRDEDDGSDHGKSKGKSKHKDRKARAKSITSDNSAGILKKLRGGSSKHDASDPSSKADEKSSEETASEEKLRQKAFVHFDCQSIGVRMSRSDRMRASPNYLKNITTGASAASVKRNSYAVSGDKDFTNSSSSDDAGDGKSNDLVLSCPFFRNELGREDEQAVGVNVLTALKNLASQQSGQSNTTSNSSSSNSPSPSVSFFTMSLARHPACCGVAILDSSPSPSGQILPPLITHRGHVIEYVDHGAYYYRHFFYGHDHQNYFGTDEFLGPIAISVKREKLDPEERINNLGKAEYGTYQYRIICRTSELTTFRGSILEDAVSSSSRLGSRGVPIKDVLEMALGEVQLSCLKSAIPGQKTADQLLKLDEQGICTTYKVGIMYCKSGQSTEEEMYNNECSSPIFEEFLDLIGQKVRLKGFQKYRGGLDCKTDTTGLHSFYTTFNNNEIMFHVSTILPFTANNHQQLLRKRHIGNDIVTVVFQEPGALPFSPQTVRSQFQHVFIIIRVSNPNSENTRYSIAVARSKDVPSFGPPIPSGGTFRKSPEFVDFLMAKIINAENAAHRSEKFRTMAQRTRQEYLKDLATNYVTNTPLDSGSKLSKFGLGSVRKKEKARHRVVPDMYAKGALIWNVQVEDMSSAVQAECFLAVAADTIVLMETTSKEVIFTIPCSTVIGWTLQASSIRLYFGQGECILLRPFSGDMEEMTEIITRLTAVSQGTETVKMVLKRNGMGQLGFHIQSEGIVTDVEPYGFAWEVGLRKGSRLVEICKVATITLTHDQIVDLLRTSAVVKVVVVPPLEDGTPRGDGKPSMLGSRTSINSAAAVQTASSSSEQNNSNSYAHTEQPISAVSSISVHGYSDSTLSSGRGSDDGRGSSFYSHSRQESSDVYGSSRGSHDGHLSSGDELHSRNGSHDSSDYSLSSISRRGLSSSGIQTQGGLRRGEASNYLSMEGSATSSTYLTSTEGIYNTLSQHPAYRPLRKQFTMEYTHSNLPATGKLALELLKQTQNTKYLLGHEPPPLPQNSPPGAGQVGERAAYVAPSVVGQATEGAAHVPSSTSVSSAIACAKQDGLHVSKRDYLIMCCIFNCRNLSGMSSEESLNSRLRPGVTNHTRPSNSGGSRLNFQEELKRLIDPDITESDLAILANQCKPFSNQRGRPLQRTLSDESLHSTKGVLGTPTGDLTIGKDVLFTTALPARSMDSSSGSDPASVELRLSSRSGLDTSRLRSKAVGEGRHVPIPLSAAGLDWSDLVSVATKAMEGDDRTNQLVPHKKDHIDGQACSDDEAPPPPRPPSPKHEVSLSATGIKAVPSWVSLAVTPEQRVKDLELLERLHSSKLETEVQNLRADNVRLQEESQTAAAQLRRFTEWFFNTIDRQ